MAYYDKQEQQGRASTGGPVAQRQASEEHLQPPLCFLFPSLSLFMQTYYLNLEDFEEV